MSNNACYREMLDRLMPWSSSTCSKRATAMPEEPAVIARGRGCRVWDADDREFIDFRNSLGPVTLGYCFPAVDNAIREQLENGIIFGYPHILEAEVAQALHEVIPCAEKVRFLKTGGEAVAAVIKTARYVSGHKHVIQIGYNGWLNSLAADGMFLPGQNAQEQVPGVPADLSVLHHNCRWNDLEQLSLLEKTFGNDLAAIVVAADYQNTDAGFTFYPELRAMADRCGAALIYDEIVTGFRIALAGMQEYCGVVPDMAVFAKAIANGMPLSVYCGKARWMDGLNKAIVSSTYGGESLSLAAAKAVINVYRTEPVIEHITNMGRKMWGGLNTLFKQYGVPASIPDKFPMGFCKFEEGNSELHQKFLRNACKYGVTLYNGGYVNYSHKENDIDEALDKLETAIKNL